MGEMAEITARWEGGGGGGRRRGHGLGQIARQGCQNVRAGELNYTCGVCVGLSVTSVTRDRSPAPHVTDVTGMCLVSLKL